MKRLFVYLWASPGTILGLVFIPFAFISKGKVRAVFGVIEIHGGLVSLFLQRGAFVSGGVEAMTLGHVVLGHDELSLDRSRTHERVHVAQYERWGPLMIPLYLLSSGVARLRGGDPYLDNRFEVEAHSLKVCEEQTNGGAQDKAYGREGR
jgi:hypothetical protein